MVYKIKNEVISIHSILDLVGSTDDRGYYFHDLDLDDTSIVYPSKSAAIADYKSDTIHWACDNG